MSNATIIRSRKRQPRVHTWRYAGLLVVIGLVAGCSGEDRPSEAELLEHGESTGLEAGDAVTVLKDDGTTARVRTSDYREVDVPSRLLEKRSQTDGNNNISRHTHVVTAPVQVPIGRSLTRLSLEARRAMLLEQMSLDRLFLSGDTLREVIAPSTDQPTLEGEKCWAAYACTNPDCPAKDQGKNGRPYLFINKIEGTRTYCPACLTLWESQRGDSEVESRYRSYPKLYVLPETQRRIDELGAIRRKAKAKRRAKRGQATL